MKEKHASMTKQYTKKNQVFRDCTGIQEKNIMFYPKRKGLLRLLNKGYLVGLRSPING